MCKESFSDLFTALVQAEITLWNHLDRELNSSKVGISLGRFLVLDTIRAAQDVGGARVQDIARTQHITVGAASRLLERLVGDGLATRHPCPEDRRAVRHRLTEDGEARLEAATRVFEGALESCLSQTDIHTITGMTEQLRELTRCVTRAPAPALEGATR